MGAARGWITVACVAVLASGCTASPAPAADPDPVVVEEVAPDPVGWVRANGDETNARVADTTITAANVHELEVAWTFSPPGQGQYGALAGEPLIVDGTVYVQDLASNIFALDLVTGEERWEVLHDEPVVGPNGPAVAGDTLVAPAGGFDVAAYDLATGEERWQVGIDSPASQPTIHDGVAYVTTDAGNYAGQTSGIIYAFDLDTGEELWRFQVLPDDFWGDEALNSGGGVWLPPALDRERGHLYWGTGNPAPFPGTADFPNASSRPGDNLYANSLIALGVEDGALAWYDNVNPGDLFDHDFHGSPITVDDAEVAGARRDVVLGSGKNGKVGAWDRDTGERLWLTEVGIHQNDHLTELPIGEPVEVYPGTLGGVETPMAAADGVVYVPVVDLPTTYEATGFGARNGLDALIRLGSVPPTEGSGELVALDIATGEPRWQVPLEPPPFAGATIVGDLVFTATLDGVILAIDRASGTEVWRFQAPAGINAWPAVHGDTIVWGAGAGPDPQLIALRLGGGGAPTPEAGDADAGDDGGAGDAEVATTHTIVTPEGSRFDRDRLVVPAGEEITVTYDNRSDIAHNIAFLGADGEVLARSEVEPGPVVQQVTFTAPTEPGSYRFRCDPHPTVMAGTLVVE